MEQEYLFSEEQTGTPESRSKTFKAKFAERHPDVDMEDDEAYYGALDDEYTARDAELSEYKSNTEKLNNLFANNPNAAYFMNDLIDGKEQLGVALMRNFGYLFKEAVDDPSDENIKAFADALDEHAERVKKNEALQAEFEKNVTASRELIDTWASERGLTAEQVDAVQGYINGEFANLLSGTITPEMLEFAYKGLQYDADVEAAERKGVVAGRNARIDEQLRTKQGDGIPMIGGGKSSQPSPDSGFLSGRSRDPWAAAKREKY